MSGVRLLGVHHVGVVVDDLEEARGFLSALGLRPAGTIEPPGLRGAFFDCNGTSIEVLEFSAEPARSQRLGDASARIDHIAFAVADLDETVDALAAIGVETTAVQDASGRRTCWTLAPTS